MYSIKKKKKIKLKFVMLESFKIVVEEILVKELQKNEEKRNSQRYGQFVIRYSCVFNLFSKNFKEANIIFPGKFCIIKNLNPVFIEIIKHIFMHGKF